MDAEGESQYCHNLHCIFLIAYLLITSFSRLLIQVILIGKSSITPCSILIVAIL